MNTIDRPQHNRFKDAPWYPKEEIFVLVGGAGGIGSWLSVLLSRAGFKPVIYDFDILEEHNLGGQLYPRKSIGLTKVEAIKNIIKEFSNDEVTIFNERITSNTSTHYLAISAFDNMAARMDMFHTWKEEHGSDPSAIFIDGRLNAEHMQILCVRGGDAAAIEKYASDYLFPDSAVEDALCTMKQTSHAAAMIASHMVGFFTNHITNVVEKDTTRSIPFYWEYFIPMDLLETK